jgi:hypothetical protein
VRELAKRFEHRLFLSATPHNGLSNSFSALLVILDPQRFCRGVKVEPTLRDEVMVRRLKSDLSKVSGKFPRRDIIQIVIKDLPTDAPELKLARMLDQYWSLRRDRLEALPPKQRKAQGLVLVNFQKRLLSSIEALYRTLKVHRKALEKAAAEGGSSSQPTKAELELLATAPGAEDERSELPEEQVEAEEEHAVEAATNSGALRPTTSEVDLAVKMEELAARTRRLPDARVRWLVDWILRRCVRGCPSSVSRPRVLRRIGSPVASSSSPNTPPPSAMRPLRPKTVVSNWRSTSPVG